MKSLAEQRRTTRSDSDATSRDWHPSAKQPSVRSSGKWSKGPQPRLREATVRSSCTGQRSIGCACRVQSEGEQALTDGRHGHPVKLRGEVLAFVVERCQTNPCISSSTMQRALQERFALAVSVSQLNRVRASLGLTRKLVPRAKKAQKRLG
jgi:transposase